MKMKKAFLSAGLLSAVGVMGFSLPGHTSVLNLGNDGCFINDGCSGSFTGGTYTAEVIEASAIPGIPSGADQDLVTGETPDGGTTTVKFTFTPIAGVAIAKLELFNPATFTGFVDFEDSWTATLTGAIWDSTSGDGNTTVPGAATGGTSISWTGTQDLATVRSADATWLIEAGGFTAGSVMLELTYENLNADFNNADALRIHVATPEPLTILGASTAIGFGAFFKRKMAKR